MSFNEEELRQLRHQETNLPPLYSVDGSSLEEINDYFPRLQGREFCAWLEAACKKGNAKVLEIGGGIYQRAALDILRVLPVQEYTAVEKRKVYPGALASLQQFASYRLLEAGVSDIPGMLTAKKFAIVFANSVAEHLPKPITLLRVCYSLLDEKGVMFFNGVPVSEGWIVQTEPSIEKGALSIMRERTPVELYDRGLVSVSVAMQKGEAFPQFVLQGVSY